MFQKLLITVMGLFLVIAAGSCNIYPLYLSSLKERFNYSLKELNLYGAFINIGNWVAITTGLIYDRIGPRACCIISGIVLPSAYITLSALLNSSLESLNIIVLLILGFIIGQASSLIATTGLNTNLKNYNSQHSTAIVGIITTNVAISPSIFTSFKEATPNMKNSIFFICVSVYLAVVITICALIFKILPEPYSSNDKMAEYENHKEKRIIRLITSLSLFTLCLYLFGVIINKINDNNSFPNVIIVPLLQLMNFAILIAEKYGVWDRLWFNKFIIEDIKAKERIDNLIFKQCFNTKSDIINSETIKEKQIDIEKGIDDNISNKDKEQKNTTHQSINAICLDDSDLQHAENNSKTCSSRDMMKDEETTDDEKDTSTNNDVNIINKQQNQRQSDNTSPQLVINQSQEVVNTSNANENIITKLKLTPIEFEIEPITAIQQLTFKQKLTHPELIALFLVLLLTIGSIISNLNNIQFIITSILITPTHHEIFQYAILYFAFNSFARIFSGIALSQLIFHNKLFYFLVVITSIGLLSQILGITLQKEVLYVSMALAGMTHGGLIAFIPVYTRLYYHINDLNIIIGLLTTGCAFGSIIIGTCIFSAFYERSRERDVSICYGPQCFRPSYILTSIFLSSCLFISVILVKLHHKKDKTQSKKQPQAT